MLHKIGKHWINLACVERIRVHPDYVELCFHNDSNDISLLPAEFAELQRIAPEHFAVAPKAEVAPAEPTLNETEINWMVSDLRHGGAVNVGAMSYGRQLKAFIHQMGNGGIVMFSFLDGGMMGVDTIQSMIRTLTKALVVAKKYQEQENNHD